MSILPEKRSAGPTESTKRIRIGCVDEGKGDYSKAQVLDSSSDEEFSDKLPYCYLCKKDTDHIFVKCPRYVPPLFYCKACEKECNHPTPYCPYATEEIKEKFAYDCLLCGYNVDHTTSDCPDKETGFVLRPNGDYVPNICYLCGKRGHLPEECDLLSDDDMEPNEECSMFDSYDPPSDGDF